MTGLLADDQDALPPEPSRRPTPPAQERCAHPSTPPRWMHHPADLRVVVGSHPGVADHLAAGVGENVHRTTEMVALVELDLQVQGFSRLAEAPQAVDVRSVPASEASLFSDVPSDHEARA